MDWKLVVNDVLGVTDEVGKALTNIICDLSLGAESSLDILNDIYGLLTTIEGRASSTHDTIKKYIKHEFYSKS